MSHITGLDHVQLAMPAGGEARARAFYVGVLGMAELPKPAHLAVNGGCWFTSGDAHIHLGVEHGFAPARKAHPALLVHDLPAYAERLESAGVSFAPGKPLDGYVRGDISDPFGNRIELMQRL
ncbi:VOC family protein [Alteraurantiacibacter aestuarii]|uniref:Glyoxalase n=1 Tax=Alteraurantiacibacter aestuarii TaxID=650004 RepID=A0A844ZKD1_9SPHN|nr:VOC family protein [Alteraurantiacibacter aestuarii]MXO87596.1 glyoxalase [Alteraurantiacibacter aestuarii]